MNAAEKARHVAALRELTAEGGLIDTAAPTATQNNSQYYRPDGYPTAARLRMQKEILNEYFAEKPDVIRDRRAIVMAGPPGAGKSSAQRERIPTADEHLWRIIDADEFKKRILKKMQDSGQYEQLIPAEVRQRMDAGETFMPGEFAALVHEESSLLSKRAARRALENGERVVLDGVNGSKKSLLGRFDSLTSNGYTEVEVIVVDGPKSVTRGRVEYRHITNFDRAIAGDADAAYDARFVPEYVTDALYAEGEDYSSCARAISELQKDGPVEGLTITASTYFVSEVTGTPVPWATMTQSGSKFTTTKHAKISALLSREGAASPPTSAAAGPGDVGSEVIVVEGYTKDDGTVVETYTRRRPGRHA